MKSIQSNIKKAKKYLDKNDCIAVPTETVYGLAGNAYSNIAVKKIFKLKNYQSALVIWVLLAANILILVMKKNKYLK